MSGHGEALRVVGVLASEQRGLFTTAQAAAAGVTAAQVGGLARMGVVERLQHGVYRAMGAPLLGMHEHLAVAWTALDPTRTAYQRLREGTPEVVSHWSAADVHDLGALDAWRLEFTVPTRRRSRNPDVVFYVGQLNRREWMVIEGLAVTTVSRTISDLVVAGIDGGHLARVVRDAMMKGHLDVQEASQLLDRHAGYGYQQGEGRAWLRRLLEEAGVPVVVGQLGQLLEGSPALGTPAQRAGQSFMRPEQTRRPGGHRGRRR